MSCRWITTSSTSPLESAVTSPPQTEKQDIEEAVEGAAGDYPLQITPY